MASVSSTVKKFWQKATGDPETFSLESRIFHAFSVLAFFLLCFELPFSLYIHLSVSAMVTGIVLVAQLFLYYLSRVRKMLKLAVWCTIIAINVLSAVDYVYKAGISGPCMLMFVMSLFMIICISDRKYWPVCVTVNLIMVVGLLILEFNRPSIVYNPYLSNRDLFLDKMVTYIMLIIVLYVGTSQIWGNYAQQKALIEEKAAALKLLNGEKDKLLSIISHDLRGPLASIQQYFGMLGETTLGEEERKALEGHLLKTITNTQELVTNVLSWAKKQIGGHKMQLHPLLLHKELQPVVELFQSVAHRKGIRLEAEIDNRIMVTADGDMLQLVVRNLLNNAIKFSNSNTVIELKAMAHNGLCMLSVKDDGIGIAINKQRDIFSLNVKSTYGTGNERGSGLGLALCREFVQMQGGDISFTSVLGKGSVFYVTLPCEVNSDL